MSHAFSDSALKGVEDFVLVHIQEYIERLTTKSSDRHEPPLSGEKNGWTDGKDLSKWSSYLGFDVMGDLSFGKSFGMLGNHPENREACFLLEQAARRHNIVRDDHLKIRK